MAEAPARDHGARSAHEEIDASVRLRLRVEALEHRMRRNCDLDNWEPERSTGHSWVCRIHKAAMGR